MKTKLTVIMPVKIGRVTPCAPQHYKATTARRGLTRPTFMRKVALPLLLLLSTLNFPLASVFAQGTAFTYQGRLSDDATPANGTYDLRFILYSADTGGTQLGPILTNSATAVSSGLFNVTLDFGARFPGANRWLEVAVRTNGGGGFITLSPRQPLTPTPYAITAESVVTGGLPPGTYGNAVIFSNAANNFSGTFTGNGTGLTGVNAATLGGLSSSNFWKLGGNAGANPANGNFLGTTDNLPLELRVNGSRALRLEPNTNGAPNIIGGSPNNFVSNSVIGATIAGGGAVISGFAKYTNSVTGSFGTVGGGAQNTASSSATVGGGFNNTASGLYATVSGGYFNTVTDNFATVSGGWVNTASGRYATVGGGDGNVASGFVATVGGGIGNTASDDEATVSGGYVNTASGVYAAVGGGRGNIASNYATTVSGGYGNTASASSATVAGGYGNTASGGSATVAGGSYNTAAGDYSFAAGLRAKANHNGAFVWADSQLADFASTSSDQFLIRAQGGVGINNASPQAPLHVNGGGDADLSSGGNFISGLVSGRNIVIDNNEIIARTNGAAADLILNFGSGNVGIGRTPTANALEVAGNASKTTAGSWLANSDARIKTDVRTVTNALDKLSRVRLVQFHYTDDYRAAHPGIEDRPYLNVVAQEFQKVFPEHVKRSGEKLSSGDDILQVDTYPLTIYSAAAIQELNARLKAKESEIFALKERLARLEAVLNQITKTKE